MGCKKPTDLSNLDVCLSPCAGKSKNTPCGQPRFSLTEWLTANGYSKSEGDSSAGFGQVVWADAMVAGAYQHIISSDQGFNQDYNTHDTQPKKYTTWTVLAVPSVAIAATCTFTLTLKDKDGNIIDSFTIDGVAETGNEVVTTKTIDFDVVDNWEKVTVNVTTTGDDGIIKLTWKAMIY